MTTHDIEDESAARELVAFEEACEKGYEGTLEDFRQDMASARKPAPAFGDDDLPF